MRWENLPKKIQDQFSLNGKIKLELSLFDNDFASPGTNNANLQNDWTEEIVENLLSRANNNTLDAPGYVYAVYYLETAFKAHPIIDKTVLVIGSLTPWVEAVALKNGAKIPLTTIDFNPIYCHSNKIIFFTVNEFRNLPPILYDVIISYSSLEHDGMGRFGDPINPNGDIERVQEIFHLIKPGGKFYLGFPMGLDQLAFNLHRVYGRLRLPLLIKGWDYLGVYGIDEQVFDREYGTQPVIILQRPL